MLRVLLTGVDNYSNVDTVLAHTKNPECIQKLLVETYSNLDTILAHKKLRIYSKNVCSLLYNVQQAQF